MIDIQRHEGESGIAYCLITPMLKSYAQGGFLSAVVLLSKGGYRAEAVSDSQNRTTVGLHWTDGDPIVAEFFVKYVCLGLNWSYLVLT
jgi:hypothetical protein